MKQSILAVLLCFSVASANGQAGIFGVHAGIGKTTSYNSKFTPAVEGYYLHKILYHFYGGGSLFFQRYSFEKTVNNTGGISYGDVVSIRQQSSFVYLSPKLDYAINYRSYFHIYATAGIGVRLGGQQWSNTHQPMWTPPGGAPYGADTVAVNTSYNLPATKTRYGLGFMARIPTHRYWSLSLTTELGMMPGSLSKGVEPLQSSYICFMVGVTHKYPRVFMEY